MQHKTESGIAQAAEELNAVLDRGAELYYRSLTTTDSSLVRAALGFGDLPENGCQVMCLFEEPASPQGSAKAVDFPVLVKKNLVKSVRAHYTEAYAAQHASSADPREQPSGQCSRSSDSLAESPHITRAMLRHKSQAFVALSWLCNPQLEPFIACRRLWMRDGICAGDQSATPNAMLRLFLKEIILLDLLLSVGPKLKCLWEYRLWIIVQMATRQLLTHTSSSEGPACLSVVRLQRQDDVTFFTAAHNHPMNYNAWHYRRCVSQACYLPLPLLGDTSLVAGRIIRYDHEKVLEFIQKHNGDCSATAYLLFLLELQEKRDDLRRLQGTPQLNASKDQGRLESDSAPSVWKSLMHCTQEEIRRHCEKGHDSMWYLRLELIRWALSRPSRATLLSSWTVEDELKWVSAYADADAGGNYAGLLAPLSVLPHAWAESFGSLAWTSYNASRYGLQLLSVLGYSNEPKSIGVI